jgi:hypothetical protein
MAHIRPLRLSALLVVSAAASALAATPALATEGPAAPPPAPSLPTGLVPPTIAPFAPAPSTLTPAPRVIRNARLVKKRVKQGRRALLRVSLTTPSRLRITMNRGGHRVRLIAVPAGGQVVALRLPARAGGHKLRTGRYRISVVAVDANGVASAPFGRTMTVRR